VRCFDIKALHIDSMQALETIINPTLASGLGK
jgi:acyl dehydratase